MFKQEEGFLIGVDIGRRYPIVVAVRSPAERKNGKEAAIDAKFQLSNREWQSMRGIPQHAQQHEKWLKAHEQVKLAQNSLSTI